MKLFKYTLRNGKTHYSDLLPEDDFMAIQELIFCRSSERFKAEGIRPNDSHPLHEAAVAALPPNLKVLRANGCKLRNWPALPTTILECYLNGNWFLELPDLSIYEELIVLELNDNNIPAVVNPLPPNLTTLFLSCNAIRVFNSAVIPSSCVNIATDSNPFNSKSSYRGSRSSKVTNAVTIGHTNLYKNNQNVHDAGVQSSTDSNIQYLTQYKPHIPIRPEKELWDSINIKLEGLDRSRKEKLADVLQNFSAAGYSMHGTTFHTLVDRIWLRIEDFADPEIRREAEARFYQEVRDGESNCLNGMMVRLVNSLVGFDENIHTKASPNQILSARIPATLERLKKVYGVIEGMETKEYFIACYRQTIEDLKEVELPRKEWKDWLETISESILDLIISEYPISTIKDYDCIDDVRVFIRGKILENGLLAESWEVQYALDKVKPYINDHSNFVIIKLSDFLKG